MVFGDTLRRYFHIFMSNMVVFFINDKIKYDKMVYISNSIVNICLNAKKGAIFNFLGYDEDLINQFNNDFYFSISDDFLQLNSNYCNVNDILNIDSYLGRERFKEKFLIFDDVFTFF